MRARAKMSLKCVRIGKTFNESVLYQIIKTFSKFYDSEDSEKANMM
jgi:hypothetical protein